MLGADQREAADGAAHQPARGDDELSMLGRWEEAIAMATATAAISTTSWTQALLLDLVAAAVYGLLPRLELRVIGVAHRGRRVSAPARVGGCFGAARRESLPELLRLVAEHEVGIRGRPCSSSGVVTRGGVSRVGGWTRSAERQLLQGFGRGGWKRQ